MTLESSHKSVEPPSVPEIVTLLIGANGRRISNTLAYTNSPERDPLFAILNVVEKKYPSLYAEIVREGIIVDLWGGHSLPSGESLKKHQIRYYVSIDLNHEDRQTVKEDTLVIEKKWDFYSVLASVPDGSIPCIYVRMIDEIIIDDYRERRRLRELIKQKLTPNGIVISSASRIFSEFSGVKTELFQPNIGDESLWF